MDIHGWFDGYFPKDLSVLVNQQNWGPTSPKDKGNGTFVLTESRDYKEGWEGTGRLV